MSLYAKCLQNVAVNMIRSGRYLHRGFTKGIYAVIECRSGSLVGVVLLEMDNFGALTSHQGCLDAPGPHRVHAALRQ